jgi:FHS family glucose/mannose:H+ symporter-like MFS transporter
MASIVPSQKSIRVATSGTALVYIDFLLTGIVMTFLGPMLPILSVRWSLTDARSGSLIFAQFFSSMFGMLSSVILVERRGYRFTFLAGLALMALGMALLTSGPWLLGIVSVCIFGIGHGITTPAGNLRTAEINPRGSAAALNFINAIWGLGAVSSPFLIAFAQKSHNISIFLYGTATALVVLLIAFALVKFEPDRRTVSGASPAHEKLFPGRLLPVICALFFIYVGTETSFGGWIASYARRLDSGPHSFWAMMPSFYWGALLAGRLLAPVALRFTPATVVAKTGLILSLLGGSAIVAAHGMGLLIVGSVLAGLGLASIFPISVSLLPGWFGESANRASGAVFASGNTGGAVLPWLVGVVSTQADSLRFGFTVPLFGAAAMLIFYLSEGSIASRTRANATT